MTGGSYGGALAAWTESTSPGTFWAYYASSAPVEAVYNYVSEQLACLEVLTQVVALLCPCPRRHADELQQRHQSRDGAYRLCPLLQEQKETVALEEDVWS